VLAAVRVLERRFLLLALIAVVLSVTGTLATPQVAAARALPHVATDQSGQVPQGIRICSVTQKCVPANPPSPSGTVIQVAGLGFIGSMIVVLAGLRRGRRIPMTVPVIFNLPSRVFRPPIASSQG
jgi:hypothetical protein